MIGNQSPVACVATDRYIYQERKDKAGIAHSRQPPASSKHPTISTEYQILKRQPIPLVRSKITQPSWGRRLEPSPRPLAPRAQGTKDDRDYNMQLPSQTSRCEVEDFLRLPTVRTSGLATSSTTDGHQPTPPAGQHKSGILLSKVIDGILHVRGIHTLAHNMVRGSSKQRKNARRLPPSPRLAPPPSHLEAPAN